MHIDETRHVCTSIMSPLSFIERSADVFRENKDAVVYGNHRLTYAQFGARINRLASALLGAGLEPGDRVAVLLPNIPPMLEAHFGIPLAGGVIVPINFRLAPAEIAYILNHSGASFLIADTEFAELVRPVIHELETVEHIINVDDEPGHEPLPGPTYEEFIHTGTPDPLPWSIQDEMENIAINYTSGTTGKPKGVVFSHRGAYINAIGEGLTTSLTPDSVYLWTLPMFHCNGWCFTWGVTALGATNVCFRKFEPKAAWEIIEKENVTHFNGAPVVLIGMVNEPTRPQKLDRPLTVTTAGAPPSPTLIEHMSELGAKIIHVYGLTETYGPFTVCEHQPGWSELSPHAQGVLLARQGVRFITGDGLRVVTENMEDVHPDGEQLGEVVMQGNMVMKGYYDDPEATAAAFRGGWFHSGDVAVRHPDGYIELRDRSKDVIITGGENVSSIEVEQCIYRNPSVLECAVVGAPHEKWGETPKAFVTLKEGHHLSEQEIIDFCREHMAHFKCPSSVEFIALPKTSTGKIQKFKLREKVWAGHEKMIQGN